MRKIKYRGIIKGSKATDPHHHRFIYGNLAEELSTGRKFILDINKVDKNTKFFDLAIEIEKGTEEQYTGFQDKNRCEIYEGDIVKREDGRVDNIVYEEGEYTTEKEGWSLFWLIQHRLKHLGERIEIIGNIHENRSKNTLKKETELTYQEALDKLISKTGVMNDTCGRLCKCLKTGDCEFNDSNLMCEDYQMAKHLKDLININTLKLVKGISWTWETKIGNCPNCNKLNFLNSAKPYICECGQRLDWGQKK